MCHVCSGSIPVRSQSCCCIRSDKSFPSVPPSLPPSLLPLSISPSHLSMPPARPRWHAGWLSGYMDASLSLLLLLLLLCVTLPCLALPCLTRLSPPIDCVSAGRSHSTDRSVGVSARRSRPAVQCSEVKGRAGQSRAVAGRASQPASQPA